MSTTSLDRATVRRLTARINDALAALAAEEGIVLTCAGGRFTSTSATLKLEVATRGDGGEVRDMAASAYKVYAPGMGLRDVPLGARLSLRGDVYAVCGMAPKSRAYPVLAKRERDGKVFKLAVEQVVRGVAAFATDLYRHLPAPAAAGAR